MRQQLSLQVFGPIGLRLLKAYEQYDPLEPGSRVSATFGELLGERPTEDVLAAFQDMAEQQTPASVPSSMKRATRPRECPNTRST